jgi:dolichol-phosphate mannosyltransferase
MIVASVSDFLIFFLLTSFGMYPPVVQVTSLILGIGCLVAYKVIYIRQSLSTLFGNRSRLFELAVLAFLIIAIRGALINITAPLFTAHPIFSFLPAMAATVAIGLLIHKQFSFSEKFLFLGVSLLCVKFLHLCSIELLPEEGYYWNYATHPSMGYIDHPPMVGWIIGLGTSIFGVHEFGVRIVAFIIALLTVLAVTLFHKKLFGNEGITTTFGICLLAPYLCGVGLFTSPDTVLAFAWILAVYNLYLVLIEGIPSRWYWAAFWVGLGMLSKYSIVLLAIPTIVFCLVDPKNRHWFKRKEPYISLLIAIGLFSPVIIWNMLNDWASFAFQSSGRVSQAISKFYLHGLLIDMAILYLPTTLLIIFKLLPYLRKSQSINEDNEQNKMNVKFLFCFIFFILPASVFILYSLRHETKLNWTGPAFLSIIPWVGYWLHTKASEVYKKATVIVASTFVIIICVTFQYLSFGLPLIPYGQSLHRILGWKAMSEAVIAQANNMTVVDGQPPVIAGMDKHFITSNLSFYAQSLNRNNKNWTGFDFASRNIIDEYALMWSIWSNPQSYKGRTILMVAKNENDLSDERLRSKFQSLEPIKQLDLKTREKVTRTYYTRVGRGFLVSNQ